jgi:hypothetical protein
MRRESHLLFNSQTVDDLLKGSLRSHPAGESRVERQADSSQNQENYLSWERLS